MAIDAIVLLERPRCITLNNTEARTEPYIWPVLIRVNDNTIASGDLVVITAPASARRSASPRRGSASTTPSSGSPARQEEAADGGPERDGSYPLDDTPPRPIARIHHNCAPTGSRYGRTAGACFLQLNQLTVRSRCAAC